MEPISIALLASAGISLAGGIAQWMQSSAADKANQKEIEQLRNLAKKVEDPDFDVSSIPPPQLKVLQQFAPAIAQYIPQKSPELIKAMSQGAVQGRQAQTDALEQYQGIAKAGSDPLLEMAQAKALRDAAAASGSAIETANQNANQRGMTPGGGLNYASQLSQAQGSQEALSQAGMANAADQYNRRMSALGNSATLGGTIRNEDVAQEQGNANILNDYNRSMADMGTKYNQYVAGTQNNAQQYNMEQNQGVFNANATNAYSAAVRNQDTGNTLKDKKFANAMTKLNTQFGLGKSQMAQNTAVAGTNNRGIQAGTDAAVTYLGGSLSPTKSSAPTAMTSSSDSSYNPKRKAASNANF